MTRTAEPPRGILAPTELTDAGPCLGEMRVVSLSDLVPPAVPLRTTIAEDGLQTLMATIARVGLLHPILVRPLPDGEGTREGDGRYEIVAGLRRYTAAQRLGLQAVPVRIVEDVDERAAVEIALAENACREDLSPLDQARVLRRLNRDLGMTQGAIAAALGCGQPLVARIIALLDLPADVQDLLRAGRLSRAHGIVLGRFKAFPPVASTLACITVEKGLPVHALDGPALPQSGELVARGVVKRVGAPGARFDPALCQRCPHEAFVPKGDIGLTGFCLYPPHWRALQAAARAARGQSGAAPAAPASDALAARRHATDRPAPDSVPTHDYAPENNPREPSARAMTITSAECDEREASTAAPSEVAALRRLLREAAVELERHATPPFACRACQRLVSGEDAPLRGYLPEVAREQSCGLKEWL